MEDFKKSKKEVTEKVQPKYNALQICGLLTVNSVMAQVVIKKFPHLMETKEAWIVLLKNNKIID